jgi:hypothetical protein
MREGEEKGLGVLLTSRAGSSNTSISEGDEHERSSSEEYSGQSPGPWDDASPGSEKSIPVGG